MSDEVELGERRVHIATATACGAIAAATATATAAVDVERAASVDESAEHVDERRLASAGRRGAERQAERQRIVVHAVLGKQRDQLVHRVVVGCI